MLFATVLFLQIASLVAIVTNVSPSCTKTLAKRVISSAVRLQAIALANAVIELVSSSEFITYHPLYNMHINLFGALKKAKALCLGF